MQICNSNKFYILLALLIIGATNSIAQIGAGFNATYQIKHSSNITADKDFYLLTVIARDKQAIAALQKSKVLADYLNSKKAVIKLHGSDTSRTSTALLSDFKLQGDTARFLSELSLVYNNSRSVFDGLINKELRPSGYYQLFVKQDNKTFFLSAWREAFKGINIIIEHYGFGKGFRYPTIDSATYPVNGSYYRYFLKGYFNYLGEHNDEMKCFYEPSLTIALDLLKLNNRIEVANYEPLEKLENKLAVAQVNKTIFKNYKYTAIMVPGLGPELAGIALDPLGRIRCELAATRYRQKLAPFIIVSGGNVHPFHTPFTEAMEMKKYLVNVDHIPASAIIIEPQARHTTTNFRNANRLLIRYGLPLNQPALCVSSFEQINDIASDKFDKRNIREMGYVPYRGKQHISTHEIVFYPVPECLHMDPIDPLDP